jgi:hypothetical protein
VAACGAQRLTTLDKAENYFRERRLKIPNPQLEFSKLSVENYRHSQAMTQNFGRGGRSRTCECRNQNPVP